MLPPAEEFLIWFVVKKVGASLLYGKFSCVSFHNRPCHKTGALLLVVLLLITLGSRQHISMLRREETGICPCKDKHLPMKGQASAHESAGFCP